MFEGDSVAYRRSGTLTLWKRWLVEYGSDAVGSSLCQHQIILSERQCETGRRQARPEDDERQQVDRLHGPASNHAEADRDDDDHREDRRHDRVANGYPRNLTSDPFPEVVKELVRVFNELLIRASRRTEGLDDGDALHERN